MSVRFWTMFKIWCSGFTCKITTDKMNQHTVTDRNLNTVSGLLWLIMSSHVKASRHLRGKLWILKTGNKGELTQGCQSGFKHVRKATHWMNFRKLTFFVWNHGNKDFTVHSLDFRLSERIKWLTSSWGPTLYYRASTAVYSISHLL